jgi:hypothetical protein
MKTENETEKHTKTETPSNEFYARLCGLKIILVDIYSSCHVLEKIIVGNYLR